MSQQWFWALAILGIFAVMLLFAGVAASESTGGFVHRAFWCPFKRLKARVVFLFDYFHRSEYKDVISCSAFEDPKHVTCEKKCRTFPETELKRQTPV